MDVRRIRQILDECMGAVDSQGVPAPGTKKVDVWVEVALKADIVRRRADEMATLLEQWPEEAWGVPMPRLGQEVTYIAAGGVLGDQYDAFRLFAFGKLLDWWDVLEPSSMLGLAKDDPLAIKMAGMGYVSISGYRVKVRR